MKVSAGLGLIVALIGIVGGIALVVDGGGLAWVGAALIVVAVMFGSRAATA